jgi:hypothetical protein
MINSAKECEAAYYELGYDNKGIKWDGVVSNPNTIPGCAWLHGAWNVNFNENLQADNNDETGNHGSICRVDGSTDNSDDEDESNDDDKELECEYLDSETGTVYREETTVACSEEDMITTVADCEKALYDLSPAGYTWMGEYSHAERIPGCRWDSNHKNFAFNTYKNPKNTTK